MRTVRLIEIADLLGVTKQRAHQIAGEKRFPAPVAADVRGRGWSRSEVQAWARRWRGEKPWRCVAPSRCSPQRMSKKEVSVRLRSGGPRWPRSGTVDQQPLATLRGWPRSPLFEPTGASPRTDPGTVVPAGTLRPESLLDDPTTELVAGQAGEKLTSRALRIKHVQYHMLSVLRDDRAFSLGF